MLRSFLKVAAIITLQIIAFPASAQTGAGEKDVLSVVERFFTCLSTRDSVGMAAILEPEGLFTIAEVGSKAKPPRTVTHAGYLAVLKKGAGTFQERYWDPTVRMDSSVAVISCPYDFHVDGNFSHCGLDVFTLVKREGQWRIAGCVFSLQKEGCLPSPLGPLKK